MARKTKSPSTVMNPSDSEAKNVDTPELPSAPLSPAKREAAKARYVSLKELATLLDRDRNTIAKWTDSGMPYVEKADRDLGKAWVFDIGECVRWLEKRAADTTAEKLGGIGLDGKTSEDEAKRRRAVAAAIITEIEAAEAVRTVVRVSHVIDSIAADYNEIRGRLQSIPDAVAVRVDARVSEKVKEVVDEQIRGALKSLKTDKGLGSAEG